MSDPTATRQPTSAGATPSHARHSWVVDAAVLLLVGLALRVPYLHLIPRYTDEVKEIQWALRIHLGQHLPLAAHNGYAGPVWNYLLAALIGLFGPSPWLPRAAILVAGSITVVATYALARTMSGRLAGALAGLLMAASYIPILLNSHVAWSACTVPLLAVLAAIAVVRAERRCAGPWLAAAAGITGVAMQAHPVAVLLVPGFGLFLLASDGGRRLLRTRWSAVAVAVGLLAYANLIAFHAASRLGTVRTALEKLGDGVPRDRTLAGYMASLHAASTNVMEMLLARPWTSWVASGVAPEIVVALGALVLVAALAYAARRGAALPLASVSTSLLLVPLFNTSYGFPLGARYLAFLLPIAYAGVGAAGAGLLSDLRRRSPEAGRLGSLALGLALAAAMAAHLGALARTYAAEAQAGRTNAGVHEILQAVRGADASGRAVPPTVLWSDRIDAKFSGGGHLHRVVAVLLALAEVPNERIEDDLDGLGGQIARCRPDCLLILAGHHVQAVEAEHAIEPVLVDHPSRVEDGEPYGLYRLGTR